MSTVSPAAGAAPTNTLDISTTSRVPISRLVKVEMRKMLDTRAGMWLLIAIGAITVLILVLVFFTGHDRDHQFTDYVQSTGGPQGFLLPVLGILLVTQEWGQRTGMVTFTLEPHRGKVIAAKIVAALVFGLIAVVLAVVLAALATVISGAPGAWDNIGVDDFAKLTLVQEIGILQGLAFGLIFLNSAAAIVTYFVLPIAFSIVAALWSALNDIAAWVDLNTAQQPLLDGTHLSGKEWGQVVTAIAIWVVLPFLAGLIRVLRAEVK
jgi:ABC-2 type transport system permease protein